MGSGVLSCAESTAFAIPPKKPVFFCRCHRLSVLEFKTRFAKVTGNSWCVSRFFVGWQGLCLGEWNLALWAGGAETVCFLSILHYTDSPIRVCCLVYQTVCLCFHKRYFAVFLGQILDSHPRNGDPVH